MDTRRVYRYADASTEIARERRENLIQRALLTTAIVTFVLDVSFVLLRLAIIIWHTIQTTTPLSAVQSMESGIEMITSSLVKTTLTSKYKIFCFY